MSLMEVQDINTFEVINAKGNDKVAKTGTVLARNNTRRAFGSELTNLAPNQIVNVDIQCLDNQMKDPVEKQLKRNSAAADLDGEQGPPLKRCRYNLRNRNESDAENTKNEEKDEKDKEKENEAEIKEENEKPTVNEEEERKRSANEEEIKSSAETTVTSSAMERTRDCRTFSVNHELRSLQLSSPCQQQAHEAIAEKTEEKEKEKEKEGLSPDIIRKKISTYFDEINNPAKWDIGDVHDDLACVHYVNDIKRRLEETEGEYIRGEHHDYMSWQKEVNIRMRVILLDWLIDVHRKFKLLPPTLYLCTNLLDRYLSDVQVPKNKLQLVGCACLWLASKYHEIYAPEIRDFVFISDDAFTKEELVKQESAIVDQLKFQLTLPTPLAFAERFLKIGNCGVPQNQKIRCLVFYLLEHGLMKYELARSLPSKLAAACLAYSLLATNSYISWPKFLEDETRYNLKDLLPIIESIDAIVKTDSKVCKHKAVRKKYASKRYCEVSALDFVKVDVKKFIASSEKQ